MRFNVKIVVGILLNWMISGNYIPIKMRSKNEFLIIIEKRGIFITSKRILEKDYS